MQQSASSRCRCVGAAMVTASTPSASSRSTPLNARHPSASETKWRWLSSGSATPTSFTPGRSAKTRAWLLPITPTPTTPTRSRRSASRVATCTMMDEVPRSGSRSESLLARRKAAGDAPARGCGHVLNQRVTSPGPLSAKLEEPVDETADALADRCVGPKTDGAFEVGGVRAGLRDVAWLHRKQLPDRWFSEGLLDEPHDLGHLDRFAIADVVDPPRCRTGCRVILGPGRIRRRRAPHEPHDRFNRVIDIGEVPAHVTAVEELDRSTLEDRFGEQPHGHVRTAPRAVDREKSQTRRREGKQMGIGVGHQLVCPLGGAVET